VDLYICLGQIAFRKLPQDMKVLSFTEGGCKEYDLEYPFGVQAADELPLGTA